MTAGPHELPELAPERIVPALRTRRIGRPYHHVAVCGSTNDLAVTLAHGAGNDGLAVVADQQTEGRGRLGRHWHSPTGESLYLSLYLCPPGPPWVVPPITLLAGAVTASVLAAAGAAPRLKWPNDVLLTTASGPRKVAGILTEMASDRGRIRHVVVGLGINVHARTFPPHLQQRATSLQLATGTAVSRAALLVDILNAFEPAYDHFLAEGPASALALWRNFGALGERCRIERDGAIVEGIALDVDPDGALRVRDDHGQVHRVMSGEIL